MKKCAYYFIEQIFNKNEAPIMKQQHDSLSWIYKYWGKINYRQVQPNDKTTSLWVISKVNGNQDEQTQVLILGTNKWVENSVGITYPIIAYIYINSA